jgi:hypothetical protein
MMIIQPARNKINNNYVAQQILFSCPPTQLKVRGALSRGGKGRSKKAKGKSEEGKRRTQGVDGL